MKDKFKTIQENKSSMEIGYSCQCFGNPGTNCFTGNCRVCGNPKRQGNTSLNDFKMEVLKDTRTPIYKGCQNKNGCFCSGECNIIIGYEEC